MQAGLALVSTVFGLCVSGRRLGCRRRADPGALAMDTPRHHAVNRVLRATALDAANAETRALIEKWGMLHAGRSAFGVAATLVYLWAIL
jgi:hypothetical protein